MFKYPAYVRTARHHPRKATPGGETRARLVALFQALLHKVGEGSCGWLLEVGCGVGACKVQALQDAGAVLNGAGVCCT